MREESHLEDMRSAIRGDFERLAERRGEQGLMRAENGGEPSPEEDAAPSAQPEASEPRSWLARLVSP